MANDATSGWLLAIDFGTTNTTAAVAAADGSGATVLEIENSRYLPSVVYRDDTGQLITGKSAVRQAVTFPERAERVPKRALAAAGHVVLGEATVPVTDLVAAVLRRVYSEATRFAGGQPPSTTVLTCPARWEQTQRDRLLTAARTAGITDPVLVAEPVAAAWWYARPAPGRTVAVFDFGGGTLDTAVLTSSEAGYLIAGPPGGDANLGGEDFDDLLLQHVSELARQRDPGLWAEQFDAGHTRAQRDLALLRTDITTAKEALSEYLVTDVAVVGYADPFRLTRAEFEDLVRPPVERGTAALRQTVTDAGLTSAGIDAVYLAGGSSRIPAVAASVAEVMGKVPEMRDDPKTVVALGALTAATAPAAAVPGPGPDDDPGQRGSTAPLPLAQPRRARRSPLVPVLLGLGVLAAGGGTVAGVLSSHNSAAPVPPPVIITTTPPGPTTPTPTTPSPTPTTPTPTTPTPTTPSPTPTPPVITTPSPQPSLSQFMPAGVHDCEAATSISGGETNTLACASVTGVTVYAYQYDNEQDYTTALQSLNTGLGFPDVTDAGCPSGYGSNGWTTWYTARYPAMTGQIVECFNSPNSSGYEVSHFVWTLPSQLIVYATDAIGVDSPDVTNATDQLAYLAGWWQTAWLNDD
jgi:Hsp70 protein